MQTEAALRIVVDGLFIQLKRDNVNFTEVRFVPFLHLKKGVDPEQVVEIVADRMAENSEETCIQSGLILCTLLSYNETQSLRVAKLVKRYIQQTCVAGLDIT